MKKLLCLISICLLCGCQTSHQDELIKSNSETTKQETASFYLDSVPDIQDYYVPMLNTMVKLTLYNNEKPEETYDLAYQTLKKYHQLLDNYHYYRDDEDNLIHNIQYINDYYSTNEPVDVDEEMIVLLKEAIKTAKLSEGYFNPFMGALIDLWSPKFSSFPIENSDPTDEEIKKAKACVPSLDKIDDILSIDEENKTVTFHALEDCEGKVSINLGAFSKGYAVSQLSQVFDEQNIEYLIDAGTSTVAVSGNRTWNAAVRSPYNKVSSLYILSLNTNEALSTSGDDNNYFLLNNGDGTVTVRCHILNPFTGISENHYRSVSVLSNNAVVTDVLSTALFSVQDEKTINKIITNFEKEYNIDIEIGLAVETDIENQKITLMATNGFNNHLLEDYITSSITEIKELP